MLGVRHFATTSLARELDAAIICEPQQNELCLEHVETKELVDAAQIYVTAALRYLEA